MATEFAGCASRKIFLTLPIRQRLDINWRMNLTFDLRFRHSVQAVLAFFSRGAMMDDVPLVRAGAKGFGSIRDAV